MRIHGCPHLAYVCTRAASCQSCDRPAATNTDVPCPAPNQSNDGSRLSPRSGLTPAPESRPLQACCSPASAKLQRLRSLIAPTRSCPGPPHSVLDSSESSQWPLAAWAFGWGRHPCRADPSQPKSQFAISPRRTRQHGTFLSRGTLCWSLLTVVFFFFFAVFGPRALA